MPGLCRSQLCCSKTSNAVFWQIFLLTGKNFEIQDIADIDPQFGKVTYTSKFPPCKREELKFNIDKNLSAHVVHDVESHWYL